MYRVCYARIRSCCSLDSGALMQALFFLVRRAGGRGFEGEGGRKEVGER